MQANDIDNHSSHLRGIILMLLGIAIFAFQDVLTAYLSRNYPIPFFVMIRYWVLLLCATIIAMRTEGGLSKLLHPHSFLIQIFRAILLVVEIGVFALALRHLQLAELHSLFAAAPLLITALSVPLLGEHVGWRRWSAVLIGFVGVLIIMRPGMGILNPWSILALFVALLFALYTIMTRLVSQHDPFSTTYWYTAFVGTLVMSLIGPFYWVIPAPQDWIWIALLCVSGTIGHLCLIRALVYASASSLQPLAPLQLVGATILGFLIFDEIPDLVTVIGAMVIVSSGLYIVWRERQLTLKATKEFYHTKEDDNESNVSTPVIRP